MKTFKLFAHRRKAATYRILTRIEEREMTRREKDMFIQIDEGTYSYLTSKIQKLTKHVGQNETGLD